MKLRLDGFWLQLVGLVILPISLLMVGLAIGGVRVHGQEMRRLVAERDERAARAAALALTEQLHHREAALRSLAVRLREGTSPQDVIAQADFLLPDFDLGLAVLDEGGQLIAGELEPSNTAGVARSGRELADGEISIWIPSIETSEPPLVLLARSGDLFVAGAFTLAEPLRSMVLDPLPSSASYAAFIVDASGRELLRFGNLTPAVDPMTHPGVAAALRGESGSSYFPAEDGEHVVAFSPIEPMRWALVIEEPWESVVNPLLRLSMAAPLVLAPVLLITLIALWFGARAVIEPLRRLERRAGQLAAGDFDAGRDAVGGIAEIQQLQRRLNWMAARMHSAQQALRGYIGKITRAQEEERRRVARDLHDETIQELIALDQQIQLAALQRRRQGQIEAEQLDDLHQTAQGAIEGIRRLSRGLRPIYLEELGLVPALEMLARDLQHTLGIPVSVHMEGTPIRLSADRELALFRIAQEALANIARHAEAKRVDIRLGFKVDELQLTITDNGVGFHLPEDRGELGQHGHFGLIGMYERAEILRGTLEVDTAPGEGTRIEIQAGLNDLPR